jgi:hypothetical protein
MNLNDVMRTLKQEQTRLSKEMNAIGAALSAFKAAYTNGKPTRRKISAGGIARIAAAQRARWAKVKTKSGKTNLAANPKKRTMSVSARRKIAAAQRARWAKVKGSKKSA